MKLTFYLYTAITGDVITLKWKIFNAYTHTHSLFMVLCLGLLGWASTRRDSHLKRVVAVCHHSDLWSRGRQQRQVHQQSGWMPPNPDHRCPHLHHPPNFMPDALPAATLPVYYGLRHATNMLDCIPGRLIKCLKCKKVTKIKENVTPLQSPL